MIAVNDRVICRVAYMPESTSGKIILATSAVDNGKTKLNVGKVISAGPGILLRTGEWIPNIVKKDDVIVWESFGAIQFEVIGKDVVCTRSEDIGCVLEESEWKGKYMFDDAEIEAYEKRLDEDRRAAREAVADKPRTPMVTFQCWNNDCRDKLKKVERIWAGDHVCETCGTSMREASGGVIFRGLSTPGSA